MAAPTTPERVHHPPAASLDLATVLRTAGEPVRLAILRLLADGAPRSCTQLGDAVGLPASTCSYHLRLLREAGLTRVEIAGTTRTSTLRRADLNERFPGLLDALVRPEA